LQTSGKNIHSTGNFVFKTFTAFLKDNDCFGKEVVAVKQHKAKSTERIKK
jgi:hypothetical protein